jgi:hypothetical protein
MPLDSRIAETKRSATMDNRRKIFAGSLLALFWFAVPLFAADDGKNKASYITFQVTGASGPTPLAINNSLTVAGDGNNGLEPNAFVRDIFGRSSIIGVFPCSRVWATGINAAGTVVGFCQGGAIHGYIRDVQGTATTFDCPTSFFTNANSINASGAVTGSCGGSTNNNRSYVRSPQGTLTEFNPPGANSNGSQAFSINNGGAIAGVFTDTSNVEHGFVRHPNGTFTVFDLPGVVTTFGPHGEEIPFDMNEAGEITATYKDSNGHFHGFVRSPQGAITTFSVQGSVDTYAFGINASGAIVGYSTDANNMTHGYIRSKKGTITSFDVPNGSFTTAFAINNFGAVTGNFSPANGQTMAFIRLPFFPEHDDD